MRIALATADGEQTVRDAVHAGLRAFNHARIGDSKRQSLVLSASGEQGAVVGGLVGCTMWSWLYVDDLWVDEAYRGRGVGAQLLEAAEVEARARGCIGAFLDTLDFQARPFYEKLGYSLFGTLNDCPAGHQRFFLQKRFA